jgi:sterol desaturase/sphingolipid hydroxylase (fatty acid hydroxylase superfamily)
MKRLDHLNRPVGCGVWVVGLLAALFAAEWLLLWLVVQMLPLEQLPLAVLVVAVLTIVVGSGVVYFRVQRRLR